MDVSSLSEKIPGNLNKWKTKALAEGVLDKYIHEVEQLNSGSKVCPDQYLAFRVLWLKLPRNAPRAIEQELISGYVEEAGGFLRANTSWQLYLKLLKEGARIRDLGLFTLVRDYQMDITELSRQSTNDNAKFRATPMKERLRSHTSKALDVGLDAGPQADSSPSSRTRDPAWDMKQQGSPTGKTTISNLT